MTNVEWNEYFSGHWYFPGVKQKNHIAMFPEELPKRLIKMFSFAGDHVLDPFMGSGTTIRVAEKLNRRCSGYEINRKYISIIQDSCDFNIELIEQKISPPDFEDVIKDLPYIFKDQNQVVKKSAAGINPVKQKNYYRITKVKSPFTFKLNTGKTVKLLGIIPISGHENEAREFIRSNYYSKPVYYTLDNGHSSTYVYLYLKNKTFINAHLIKKGLADVDDRIEFRHKKRFLSYLPK